jgi:hypothetical protein
VPSIALPLPLSFGSGDADRFTRLDLDRSSAAARFLAFEADGHGESLRPGESEGPVWSEDPG